MKRPANNCKKLVICMQLVICMLCPLLVLGVPLLVAAAVSPADPLNPANTTKAAPRAPFMLSVAWDFSTNATSYVLTWGTNSLTTTNTSAAAGPLQPGVSYRFTVQATLGTYTSGPSAPLVFPMVSTNVLVSIWAEQSSNLVNWSAWPAMPRVTLTNPATTNFLRLNISQTNIP